MDENKETKKDTYKQPTGKQNMQRLLKELALFLIGIGIADRITLYTGRETNKEFIIIFLLVEVVLYLIWWIVAKIWKSKKKKREEDKAE